MDLTPILDCLVPFTLLTGFFLSAGKKPRDREAGMRKMIDQLVSYRIRSGPVLDAMRSVQRHLYVPEEYRDKSDPYGNHPCPVGYGQTISQPFIVAYMTQSLDLGPGDKVLEIGTGSGYQSAVLAELGVDLYTVEIIPELAQHARKVLADEGYAGQVRVREGNGYEGWAEYAPYDAIIGTCAPVEVPRALTDQLAEGGRIMLPVGRFGFQRLVLLRKVNGCIEKENDIAVRFVPMVGAGEG
jgi:protein-L-isoaspartate(D-aspartate) O-methyltransferase